MKLAQFMVRARTVAKYFHTRKPQVDVRTVWCEELLTCLRGNLCIKCLQNTVPKWNRPLSSGFNDRLVQLVLFDDAHPPPSIKPARFAIVSIIRQKELWPNTYDLLPKAQNSAIISNRVVEHRDANIAQNALHNVAFQNLCQGLGRVNKGINLMKVILTPVSRYLQLGPNTVCGPEFLGLDDGALDALLVTLKVKRPLVKPACGHRGELHCRC
mmetsp:Transcript_9463/g.15490  ORF Transcript_9463/g.15490 Transcript_9463/m.15490 type:complete len:213 (+) Transcript_9463:655-1293(+)